MCSEETYTEEQVIGLRERHGATLPHLSVKAQLAAIKRDARLIAAAKLAGHDTAKAETALAARTEQLEASASLQSFTDRHLLDAGGYAVANAGLMHRVEPVTTIATIGAYILRQQAPDLEVIWQDYRKATEAHILLKLSNLPNNAEIERRRLAGLRLLSDAAAALPEAGWSLIAAKHEMSVATARRLVKRAEELIAEQMGTG